MRRWGVLQAAALMLLATGAAPAAAAPAGGGCRIASQGRLPLTLFHSRFTVPAEVDGKPLTMLLDTGAERAALSARQAKVLNLPTDPDVLFRTLGIGGRTEIQSPLVARSVRFGPKTWPNYDLQTVTVVRPDQAAEPAAPVGVIGADMLSAYDVELDFPARTLTLYAVTGCAGRYSPWTGRYDVLAAEPGPEGLLIVPVTINGHRLRALLDTGSNTSSLGASAARTLGVDSAALKRDPKDGYLGMKGAEVAARRHRFAALTIGGATYPGPVISVQGADLDVADMLLGMDYLRGDRLWLSYRTRQMFMQPATP